MISRNNGYGPQVLRVLRPTSPAAGLPHHFVYVLPVEVGLGTTFGDGLETLRAANAQNQYNLTIVAPSFGLLPWYADNPLDPGARYEAFTTGELVPWVKQKLATSGTEQHWLLGFSKSGIGGMDLFLKHPDLFALVGSWDFPAEMSSYNQYSGGAGIYGTDQNFQDNERLTVSFLEAHKAPLVSAARIWIGSYADFTTDVASFDMALTSLGILHATETPASMAHRWDSGWVPVALSALQQQSSALP
jgi:S-formylglutathione hydrolase FrmB